MARPRSEHAHNAALEATLELLLHEGVEGVTLEEVAARSGVAKSTLYRHFGTRSGLISKAARRCLVEHPTPDTGSLEGDLHFLFERFREAEDERRINDLLPLLMDEAKRDPEIDELRTILENERLYSEQRSRRIPSLEEILERFERSQKWMHTELDEAAS